MTTELQKFEGWALVNVLGHQSHVGYVTTEYYGSTVLFRVATPELPAREVITDRSQYISGRWLDKDQKIALGAVAASEILVGGGSIYSIMPTTEEKVFAHMRDNFNAPVLLVTTLDGKPVEEPEMTF